MQVRQDIGSLQYLTTLTHLSLVDMKWGASSLEAVRNHPSLVSLEIIDPYHIQSYDVIGTCSKLETLAIRNSPSIHRIDWISQLSSLKSLDLSGCLFIPSLEPVAHCSLLKTLNVRDCSMISSLEPIAHCSLLEKLDARYCKLINRPTQFQCLEACSHLTVLLCGNEDWDFGIHVVLRGGLVIGTRYP